MRSEVLGHGDLIAENLGALVGMFRAAIVAPNPHLLRGVGNGKRRVGVGFCERDLMRVGCVSLVVKTLVLADYNPEVCSCVNHEVPTSPRAEKSYPILAGLGFKVVT
jgi:hypothetical protein